LVLESWDGVRAGSELPPDQQEVALKACFKEVYNNGASKPARILLAVRSVPPTVDRKKGKEAEISEQAYYRWRKEYGGLQVDQARLLKELESENAKLRDEFLNAEIFYSIQEMRVLAERWRVYYNTIPPHSSLGYCPRAPETWMATI